MLNPYTYQIPADKQVAVFMALKARFERKVRLAACRNSAGALAREVASWSIKGVILGPLNLEQYIEALQIIATVTGYRIVTTAWLGLYFAPLPPAELDLSWHELERLRELHRKGDG